MSNEKLARQWAEEELKRVSGAVGSTAAADYILATTTPPTMADVEWDDEKYFLAGATDSDGDPCVMVKDRLGDEIWIIDPSLQNMYRLPTYKLTPNGKRYELREVGKSEPDHPEVLETVADYKNAPEGTVVAHRNGRGVDLKYDENNWRYTGLSGSDTDFDMAGSSRRVLRWGGEA